MLSLGERPFRSILHITVTQKLKDHNELLQNKVAKAEESEEKLKQPNRRLSFYQ